MKDFYEGMNFGIENEYKREIKSKFNVKISRWEEQYLAAKKNKNVNQWIKNLRS